MKMKPFLDISASSSVVAKRAAHLVKSRVHPAQVEGWAMSVLSTPDLERVVGGVIIHPNHLADYEIASLLKRFKIIIVKVIHEQLPHASGGTVNYLPDYFKETVESWKAAGAHGVVFKSDMWTRRYEALRVNAFEQANAARICQEYEMVHMPFLGVVREDVDTIQAHLDDSQFLLKYFIGEAFSSSNWAMTIPMVEPILAFSEVDKGWGVERLAQVNRDLISVFPNALGLALAHRSKELSGEVIGALQAQVKKPQLVGVFTFHFSTAFEYWFWNRSNREGFRQAVMTALVEFSP